MLTVVVAFMFLAIALICLPALPYIVAWSATALVVLSAMVLPPLLGVLVDDRMSEPSNAGLLIGCVVSVVLATRMAAHVWYVELGKLAPWQASGNGDARPQPARAHSNLDTLQQSVRDLRAERESERQATEAQAALREGERGERGEQQRRQRAIEKDWPAWSAKFDDAIDAVNTVLGGLQLPQLKKIEGPPAWEPVRRRDQHRDWRDWSYYGKPDEDADGGDERRCLSARWVLDLTVQIVVRLSIADDGYVHVSDQYDGDETLIANAQSGQIADMISLVLKGHIIEIEKSSTEACR